MKRMKVTLNVYQAARTRMDYKGSLSRFLQDHLQEFFILQEVDEMRKVLNEPD